MKESITRWIIGGTAAALWVSMPLTATIELALHWYLAIGLATALASLGVLACMVDAMAGAREAQGQAAMKAAADNNVKVLCAAIGEHARRVETAADKHATRVETATEAHGEHLQSDVFTLDRWMANTWRGETLAQYDAALEAAARTVGGDTGPLPIISGR